MHELCYRDNRDTHLLLTEHAFNLFKDLTDGLPASFQGNHYACVKN